MKMKVAALGLFCLTILGGSVSTAEESYQVIVNASNPVSSMSRKQVSKMFLKRVTRWDGGLKVDPVDQDADSPARRAFTTAIHRKEVDDIEALWRRVLFSGMDVPPVKLVGDEKVLEFVRANAGAISYVSSATRVGDGVKAIQITDLTR